MIELAKDPAVTDTTNLLTHYGFDLGGYSVEQLLDRWLRNYPISWLRPAVIEALYQGRYKAVSVEQILTLWRRRGQPLQHFNHEFERILCSRLPHTLTYIATSKPKSRSAATVSESQPDALALPHISTTPVNLVKSPLVQSHVSSEALEPDSNLPASDLSETSDLSEISELSTTSDVSVEVNEGRSLDPPQLLLPASSNSPSSNSSNSPSSGSDTAQVSQSSSSFNKANLILWSDGQSSKLPIHRFVPAPATSEFYIKLKAVAHSGN